MAEKRPDEPFNPDRWETEIDKNNVSQCLMCRRDRMDGTCEAYPEGIPQEILRNDVDHNEPFKGDQGLTFEAVETSD